jgi:hypothetical protein
MCPVGYKQILHFIFCTLVFKELKHNFITIYIIQLLKTCMCHTKSLSTGLDVLNKCAEETYFFSPSTTC